MDYKDFPIADILKGMERQVALGRDVYFKWTCDGCGERVTADEPNSFSRAGYVHTEKADGSPCGILTVPTAGNYLVVGGAFRRDLRPGGAR